jgi:hypothetical protein
MQIPHGALIYAIIRLGIFRWADTLRLPAPAPDEGHPYRAAARGVDLPRCPQRLPALPLDLRRRRLVALDRIASSPEDRKLFTDTSARKETKCLTYSDDIAEKIQ